MDALDSAARPAREAYRFWAGQYLEETAVSALEDHAVTALASSVTGKRVLDAGCGTGRRLAGAAGASLAVGIDLVPEMLLVGRERWPELAVAAADLRALPFADGQFDTVWCRLALGHARTIAGAYRELARVSRPGAALVVTDFHPDAARAGHTRTFRGGDGRLHQVEHHLHDAEEHQRTAAAAGWTPTGRRDVVIGPEIQAYYEAAGALDRYKEQEGLALVLLLSFRIDA